jgi:CRISPR-associated endonuclease/helicase Cas3
MIVYAKSSKESLAEHTKNALSVFESIESLFPYIPSLCGVEDFWRQLFLCLFFHDLGKAATGFQEELEGKEWNYRHEILSAGFALNLNLSNTSNMAVALSILTHHYGCQFLGENYRTYGSIHGEIGKRRWQEKVSEMKPNQPYLFSLFNELPNWSEQYLGERLSLPETIVSYESCKDALELCLKPLINGSLIFSNKLYPILLRGLTIACDHLASADKKAIREGLHQVYQHLVNAGEIGELKGFQNKMMNLSSSACLTAPTGTGKTAAALLWCQKNQDSGRRIFYVLPYTASINAMQQRLKNIFGEDEVGILHHRANYFIYKSFLEQSYSPEELVKLMRETVSTTKKIYRPIKVLTPYQIIKAFYGVKGFEILLSEMAGGLFIFDEIHCYEPRTVALIAKVTGELNKLGAKFLFMSATLPKFLLQILSKSIVGSSFITLNPNDEVENGILEQARHKVFQIKSEITECVEEIKKHLNSGRKILIVCNAVKRAQEMYISLKLYAQTPYLIHSRFVTMDRERIEKGIADADLLVGTQAIEVSLNFDFDVIFTEPAPIDALLQRFGRVNRFGKSKGPAPVYVFERGSKADEYIYDQERVTKTLSLLPQGGLLTNQRASELVDELYKEGYSEREQKEYKRAYEDFSYVVQRLPLFDESEFKQDFFELIKAFEVVPIRFQSDYIALKKEKRYLDSVGYLVPIALQQYHRLKREERVVPIGGDLFVDARYSSELGLILDEREQGYNLIF